MVILDAKTSKECQRFSFPRQPDRYQYCLTDFIHPEKEDIIAFFVVTSGNEILEYGRKLKDDERF